MLQKTNYTANQSLPEAWNKFEGFLTDNWPIMLLLIAGAFLLRWLWRPAPVDAKGKAQPINRKPAYIVTPAMVLGSILYFSKGNFQSIGLPDINWWSLIIGVVVLTALLIFGYKAFIPRKWIVSFVQSKPTVYAKVYWPSMVSMLIIITGIMGMIFFNYWWVYPSGIVLVLAGYLMSMFINIPLRQVMVPTWFGKPMYPVFGEEDDERVRKNTPGHRIINCQKVLTVGLHRLRWVPTWFGPLDFIPLAYVKREGKHTTDWLESEALPEKDPAPSNPVGKEAVAAGPSFKLEYREAHRFHPDYADVYLALDDDERNNIDEYVVGVIDDWLADYMNGCIPAEILHPDFLKKMSGKQINRVRAMRGENDEDLAKRKGRLWQIQEDLNDLFDYVLRSTAHEIMEFGVLRREPDKNYKAQLDEYARKQAEKETALRDIDVQSARGRAFMARLTAMTEEINVSLKAMGRNDDELVTVNEVWDQIIEDQRSMRAASHVVGAGKVAGLLSSLAKRK